MSPPPAPDLLFAQVEPDRQAEAFALLWPAQVAADRRRHFELASAGSLQSVLWGAWRDDRLVGVIRAHIQAGQTSTVAPPRLVAGEPLETAAELIRQAAAACREAGCQVLQALLSDLPAMDARVLELGGLRHVADLRLLMSLPVPVIAERPQLDFALHDVGQVGEQRLAEVVQRTYAGSLDCPQIEGVRSLDNVLAGYRASGPFAPERWLVAHRGGVDVGCLLLTAVQEPSQWELTYLGVIPAARGSGLGVQLVRHAQWMARAAGGARLVVAVDALNAPAVRVYEACGFIEYDRRRVFWRAL